MGKIHNKQQAILEERDLTKQASKFVRQSQSGKVM